MLKGSTEFSKIILACGFTDIRRGVDGLAAIARLHYDLDTTEAGTLFLFCGRKRDRIKGLLWEGDGYVLVYKRLVNGFYHWPRDTEEAKLISQEQFDMFMNGFTVESSIKTIPTGDRGRKKKKASDEGADLKEAQLSEKYKKMYEDSLTRIKELTILNKGLESENRLLTERNIRMASVLDKLRSTLDSFTENKK